MIKQTEMNLSKQVDICANNHGGDKCSQAAHKSIVSTKEATWKAIVDFVETRGSYGATSYEIMVELGMRQASVSARLSELKTTRKLVPNENRRKTDSGRNAAVLVVPKYL